MKVVLTDEYNEPLTGTGLLFGGVNCGLKVLASRVRAGWSKLCGTLSRSKPKKIELRNYNMRGGSETPLMCGN